MGTSLVAIKDELHSLPRVEVLRDVLAPFRLPVEAWRASFLMDVERNISTFKYISDLQSVVASAVTIAVLGLRMDRATQQSCVVPFKGKAQPIIQVQGYTTIAGRSGFTMQSRLIREGDEWEEVGGTSPGIVHRPRHRPGAKAIATYAIARSANHPVLFTPVMMLDEILTVRDRSKGYVAAKDNGNPHPWATDFEAMMLKTPKRRLQKDIPNDQLAQAGWLDTMHDLGRVGYLSPGGQAIEPTEILPPRQAALDADADILTPANPPPEIVWRVGNDGREERFGDADLWTRWLLPNLARADTAGAQTNLERNRAALELYADYWPDQVAIVRKAFAERGAK